MTVEALNPDEPIVLVYSRYKGRDYETFPSIEDALDFVKDQEDRGEMWAENIFIEGKAIYRERHMMDAFPPAP